MNDTILRRFEQPDQTRTFEKGRFDLVRIGGMSVGRATYEPGWKWSVHVAPLSGQPLCTVEHVGLVVSGRAVAAFADGKVVDLSPGELFYIPPVPHDSWVIGDEPYVSLHFLGADEYTK
jgi:quercetin dioxygenase-like cupin family protein